MTYEECLTTCEEAVRRYSEMRDSDEEWASLDIQDIRDELGEALVFFGPTLALLRNEMDQAEADRKVYYEKRKLHWKEHFKGERGTASLVESNALIDSKEVIDREIICKDHYHKARILVDRIDQFLNGVASRIKLNEKYD